jgi:hypothetical protein
VYSAHSEVSAGKEAEPSEPVELETSSMVTLAGEALLAQKLTLYVHSLSTLMPAEDNPT